MKQAGGDELSVDLSQELPTENHSPAYPMAVSPRHWAEFATGKAIASIPSGSSTVVSPMKK